MLARGGWEAQGTCQPSSHVSATSMLLPLRLPQDQYRSVRASLPTCLSLLSLDAQGKSGGYPFPVSSLEV